MSKETFNQLMGQFSAEAEAQRAAEQRELQRRETLKKIGNVFCWLLLAAVAVAGYVFRDEIGQATEKFAGSQHQPAEVADSAGAEAPNRFRDLKNITDKHAAAVDTAGDLDHNHK